jgi:hypothetical protein
MMAFYSGLFDGFVHSFYFRWSWVRWLRPSMFDIMFSANSAKNV